MPDLNIIRSVIQDKKACSLPIPRECACGSMASVMNTDALLMGLGRVAMLLNSLGTA